MENISLNQILVLLRENYHDKCRIYSVNDDSIQCIIGRKLFLNITFRNNVLSLSSYDDDKLSLGYIEPLFSKLLEKKPSIVYKMKSDSEKVSSYVTLVWGESIKMIIDSILADHLFNMHFKPTNVHEIESSETVVDALNRIDSASELVKTR